MGAMHGLVPAVRLGNICMVQGVWAFPCPSFVMNINRTPLQDYTPLLVAVATDSDINCVCAPDEDSTLTVARIITPVTALYTRLHRGCT